MVKVFFDFSNIKKGIDLQRQINYLKSISELKMSRPILFEVHSDSGIIYEEDVEDIIGDNYIEDTPTLTELFFDLRRLAYEEVDENISDKPISILFDEDILDENGENIMTITLNIKENGHIKAIPIVFNGESIHVSEFKKIEKIYKMDFGPYSKIGILPSLGQKKEVVLIELNKKTSYIDNNDIDKFIKKVTEKYNVSIMDIYRMYMDVYEMVTDINSSFDLETLSNSIKYLAEDIPFKMKCNKIVLCVKLDKKIKNVRHININCDTGNISDKKDVYIIDLSRGPKF